MFVDIIVAVLAVLFVVFMIAKGIIEYKRKGISSLQCGDCSRCSKSCFKGVVSRDEQEE